MPFDSLLSVHIHSGTIWLLSLSLCPHTQWYRLTALSLSTYTVATFDCSLSLYIHSGTIWLHSLSTYTVVPLDCTLCPHTQRYHLTALSVHIHSGTVWLLSLSTYTVVQSSRQLSHPFPSTKMTKPTIKPIDLFDLRVWFIINHARRRNLLGLTLHLPSLASENPNPTTSPSCSLNLGGQVHERWA